MACNTREHRRYWGDVLKKGNERQILRKQLRHPWLVKRNWLWHYQKGVNGGSVTESWRPARVLLQRCFEVGNTVCLGCAGLAALAPSDMAFRRGLFGVGVLTAYTNATTSFCELTNPRAGGRVSAPCCRRPQAHAHVGLRGEGASWVDRCCSRWRRLVGALDDMVQIRRASLSRLLANTFNIYQRPANEVSNLCGVLHQRGAGRCEGRF
jgi:hypothetical protein